LKKRVVIEWKVEDLVATSQAATRQENLF
jgi:hypothetical protein